MLLNYKIMDEQINWIILYLINKQYMYKMNYTLDSSNKM